MNFYLDEQSLSKSSVLLNNDYSFKLVNNGVWDFQISIEPYTALLLNFNYDLKLCAGMEGYLNLYKCKDKRINLNIKKIGALKVEDFCVSKDAYGMSYTLFNDECCFDNSKKIFGIGNIDCSNDVFEIGVGQYVKIKDGQLLSIFIQF